MKGKLSEIRTVVVLVFITIAVCVAGVLLYKNLSSISDDVSASYQKQSPPSENVRQITVEFRDAENSIKSYNLTQNDDYLIAFFKSASLVEEKLGKLQKDPSIQTYARPIIDSIVQLSEERFELLKKQLFLVDEKNVTNELNVISEKIKETNEPVKATELIAKDTAKEERPGFFSRLFGKKKKKPAITEKVAEEPIKTQKQIDSISAEIVATVQYVKQRQFKQIQNRQSIEMQTETRGKAINDKIHGLYLQLEKGEKIDAQSKIAEANRKVNSTKNLGIIVSVIISLLLLLVTWFIIFYSHKKLEYEKALLKAKMEAEDLAKTKEMFLANMSHEIKTPLNAIYGFTDQVLRSQVSTEQRDQLNVVKKSATHLINLITDILNYSKMQSGKMHLEISDFDLKEELHEIEALFKPIATNKNILLIIETSSSLPKYIQGDLTKFKQVLMNIIGNAIKFTEKGHVKVVIEKDEFNKKAQHQLAITITDTGIGIPKDKIGDLFNEYQQAHASSVHKYGGTGLGLVITKKLVELMGGNIRLESEENKGTRAFITLAFSEGKEPDKLIKNKNYAINTDSLQGKKVLVVDDEEYNRLLLKTILSKHKIHVFEAADGAEAIKIIRATPVDLVIMDLNMPIKNGIDACKEIRTIPGMTKEHLSILVSSAVQNDDKAEELKKAGFNGSLFKPFTEEELIQKLLHFTNNSSLRPTFTAPEPALKNTNGHKLSFENIESIANGDDHFKKEMIAIFHRSINQGSEHLEEACKLHLWKEVSDIAHKMMPPCKHFEAEQLYSILGFFETINERGDGEPIVHQKLKELKEELTAINSELKIYL